MSVARAAASAYDKLVAQSTRLYFSATDSISAPRMITLPKGRIGASALLGILESALKGIEGERYFHYTNGTSAEAIASSGTILARQGFVYVTPAMMGPRLAELALFAGNPFKAGYTDFVVSMVFDPAATATLVPDPSIAIGYMHPGSIRSGRNGVNIIGVFENPFDDPF